MIGSENGEEGVLGELRQIWVEATAASIASDLDRARLIAASAPAQQRETAGQYVEALRRLESWLRDR